MKASSGKVPVHRIAVAQLGARMHYAVPRIFEEAGLLGRFYTDSYVGNKPALRALLKAFSGEQRTGPLKKLGGRIAQGVSPGKVTSFDMLGLTYQRRLGRAVNFADRMRVHAEVSGAFCRKVAGTGLKGCDAVWAFNGAAREIFTWARSNGRTCILEQTMAPYNVHDRLMREENLRWPGWQPDLELTDLPNPFGAREIEEWSMADRIVCGSQFVVDGIEELGGPIEKCVVVPYAVDLATFKPHLRQTRHGRPLRVLFAGEVGLRKGVPYLLEALAQLGTQKVEARLVGRIKIPSAIRARFAHLARFEGIVPRQEMPKHFAWADVFVLPSIVEGSATVIYEAIASGVPVICSSHSGALPSASIAEVEISNPKDLAKEIEAFARGEGPRVPDESTRTAYGSEAYSARLLTLFELAGNQKI